MPGYTEFNAVLRFDLAAFTRKVFHTVSPGVVYHDNWHIDAIAWQLLRCQDREVRRLLITQDTGGAIKGPVRGDVFWGYGPKAAARAGRMKHIGAYYLLLPRAKAARPVAAR